MKEMSFGMKALVMSLIMITLFVLRGKHIPGGDFLPDPSLFLFFLAGFLFVKRYVYFIMLFVISVLTDLLAFQSGVSDSCFTLAYWFLIPTYAVMWLGGAYFNRKAGDTWLSLGYLLGISTLCGFVAFQISTGSFYLLSGHFDQLSPGQYFSGMKQYLPGYMLSVYVYMIMAFVVYLVSKELMRLKAGKSEVSRML